MKCKKCKTLQEQIKKYEYTNEYQSKIILELRNKLSTYDDYSIGQHKETINMQARLIKHFMEWVDRLECKK